MKIQGILDTMKWNGLKFNKPLPYNDAVALVMTNYKCSKYLGERIIKELIINGSIMLCGNPKLLRAMTKPLTYGEAVIWFKKHCSDYLIYQSRPMVDTMIKGNMVYLTTNK